MIFICPWGIGAFSGCFRKSSLLSCCIVFRFLAFYQILYQPVSCHWCPCFFWLLLIEIFKDDLYGFNLYALTLFPATVKLAWLLLDHNQQQIFWGGPVKKNHLVHYWTLRPKFLSQGPAKSCCCKKLFYSHTFRWNEISNLSKDFQGLRCASELVFLCNWCISVAHCGIY